MALSAFTARLSNAVAERFAALVAFSVSDTRAR